MTKMQNPAARAGANRGLKVKAFSSSVDFQDPTEIHPEIQSELLAVRSVMRRFSVTYWHAKTICRLSGLGGHAA
ncbi:hypothetical protein ACEQ6A_10655 [Rhizobium brockwellii]|uniref:hypothetical protein n=1 Tax=Rhizobium TaxID=379 RepID=UPI001030614B|nr:MULTISPECIES: hypothetical protein [Rhizobium]MBY3224137.1 hypothetical protein [Rhizobium laguerreae]TAX99134.1 hypothetical protein ELH94_22690 [Rhizobium leguminosarum]